MSFRPPEKMLSTEYDLEDGQTSARSSTLPNSPAPAKVEQSPPMNLLWIPHSGSATTEETKPDHREINRRAQQNAFMKRKLARQQEFPRKKLVPPTRVSADLVRREADTPEPVVGIQRWPQSTSLTSTINPSQDYHAPSVRIYLDSLKLNPFRSGKVSMTPEMENIIMYYFTVIMPAVEPVQAEREDYNSWLVPLTASEPALLYALIGCMAYDMEQVSVVGFGPNSRLNLTQERVHYRIKAIQALNEALADPKTAAKPSTLVAVHFLLWQEIFAGDECIHLDGVQRLLELRGGFDGVQRKAIEAIMVGSFWRAIRTRTKPLLPMVKDEIKLTDEKFLSVLSKSEPSIARLGEGLLEPAMREYFDDEFWQLLHDTRRAWVCFERIGIHDFPVAEKRQVSIKRVNVDHRLLSYPFDHYGAHRPIQEACRLALITYSNAHYNVIQPSSKIARGLVEDLRNALEATALQSYWGTAHNALLWVLFIGAHMSYGQRERPWFVAALARVAQTLQSRDWLQVRALLVSFYYSDRVFQESFRKIWEEVELLSTILSKWF
ncbi:hypothetical protein PV05_00034 [Exophiala xenobiotica]|uniref:Transcription factor domain-containing protein n=1 Tax=Exophiala xenobiotica TaxID=348802 RepID=A0A0D2DBS9_9EURO|nr:uncharacterized protein PV05_00034 [Exophiala xenobiotica]KIW59767.1 hypothetical protein PV05_00034 [Exophiala xenobiotica]